MSAQDGNLSYIKKEIETFLNDQQNGIATQAMQPDVNNMAIPNYSNLISKINGATSTTQITSLINATGFSAEEKSLLNKMANRTAVYVDDWTDQPLPGMPAGFKDATGNNPREGVGASNTVVKSPTQPNATVITSGPWAGHTQAEVDAFIKNNPSSSNSVGSSSTGYEQLSPQYLSDHGLNPDGTKKSDSAILTSGPWAGHTQAEADAFVKNTLASSGSSVADTGGFSQLTPQYLSDHGLNPDGTKMSGEAFVNAVAAHPENFSQQEKDQLNAFFAGVANTNTAAVPAVDSEFTAISAPNGNLSIVNKEGKQIATLRSDASSIVDGFGTFVRGTSSDGKVTLTLNDKPVMVAPGLSTALDNGYTAITAPNGNIYIYDQDNIYQAKLAASSSGETENNFYLEKAQDGSLLVGHNNGGDLQVIGRVNTGDLGGTASGTGIDMNTASQIAEAKTEAIKVLGGNNGLISQTVSVQDTRDKLISILNSDGSMSADDKKKLKDFDAALYTKGISFDYSNTGDSTFAGDFIFSDGSRSSLSGAALVTDMQAHPDDYTAAAKSQMDAFLAGSNSNGGGGSSATGLEQLTPQYLSKHGMNADGSKMADEDYVKAVAAHPENFSQQEKDQLNSFFAGVEKKGGGQGGAQPTAPNPSPMAVSAAAPAHMFTLIRADGDPAVYVLNNRGERFHVSETLMHEMQQGGSWYEPEVKPQAEINAMTLRYTVDSTENLGTINNAVVGNNMMLIKGSGGDLPDDQLVGNGRAVYAVNEKGEKFHVTGEAFNQLTKDNGGTPPVIATISQAAVDSNAINGTLNITPSGNLVTTDPLMDQALKSTATVMGDEHPVPNPAPIAAAPAPEVPADESLAVTQSTQSTAAFNFVRGDDGSIFAVNAGNQKFHISPELWGKLGDDQKHFTQMSTSDINAQFNDGSTVALTDLNQLRSININAGQEFRLVKGSAANLADPNQLVGNGAAVYAINANGDKYHVTAELAQKMGGAFNNIETLNQNEIDNQFGASKGDLKTVKDLNSAVKNVSASGGFAGDTSAIPGGLPAMPGYTPQK